MRCPACGEQNRPDATTCHNCRVNLADALVAATRAAYAAHPEAVTPAAEAAIRELAAPGDHVLGPILEHVRAGTWRPDQGIAAVFEYLTNDNAPHPAGTDPQMWARLGELAALAAAQAGAAAADVVAILHSFAVVL